MTFIYRNSNTGQVIALEQRDPCLDMLDNWRILRGPDTEAGPASDSGPASAGPDRPSEHDNKAMWINYAVARGMPEADAKSLSKAALVEEFGGDEDGEE